MKFDGIILDKVYSLESINFKAMKNNFVIAITLLLMKRYFFSLILMAAIFAAAITSCNKDDMAIGMVISGTLEFSERYNDEITKVKVVTNMDRFSDIRGVVLASGTYFNGDFSLELPVKVDDQYLEKRFDFEDLPPHFKVSNKNVKTGVFSISATNLDDTKTELDSRFFYLSDQNPSSTDSLRGSIVQIVYIYPLIHAKSDDKSTTEAWYLYADRNCSITGAITTYDESSSEWGTGTFMVEKTLTYSMHLKRGWNIVYYTETQYMETADKQIRIDECSTNPVNGLKWYVVYDYLLNRSY